MKAIHQVLVLDLYHLKANSFSFPGNNPQFLHAPRFALEQRLPGDLPAVLLIAFLGHLLGSKAMRDIRFTSVHTIASLERTACPFSGAKG